MGTIDKSVFVHPEAVDLVKKNPAITITNSADASIAKDLTQVTRELKHLKQPDGGLIRPLMPYMRYSNKMFDVVQQTNSSLRLPEIGRIIGQQWRNLTPVEKQVYIDAYELEKAPYIAALERFQCTEPYQAYLRRKEMLESRKRQLEQQLQFINGKAGGIQDTGINRSGGDLVNVSSVAQTIASMPPASAARSQHTLSGGHMLPTAARQQQQVPSDGQPAYRYPPHHALSYQQFEQPPFTSHFPPPPMQRMGMLPASNNSSFLPLLMPLYDANNSQPNSHPHAFRGFSADGTDIDSGMFHPEKHVPGHGVSLPYIRHQTGHRPQQPYPPYLTPFHNQQPPLHAQMRGAGIPIAPSSSHLDSVMNNALSLRQPRPVDATASQKLASIRFRRNQALMYEIFNDTPVPDAPVVTQARVDLLRQQIAHLEMHRERLVKEVEELGRQCAETSLKRRRSNYYDSDPDVESNLFDDDDELKPQDPPDHIVTPKKFTEMFKKAYAEMVAADQLRQSNSLPPIPAQINPENDAGHINTVSIGNSMPNPSDIVD